MRSEAQITTIIYWIKKSLLMGYGYETPSFKILKIGHPNSCHNYALDFMYMGGIVICLILLIILLYTFFKIKKNTTYSSLILSSTICSYFILWFATPIHKDVLCIMFLIFTMACNLQTIKKNKEDG